MINQLDQFFQGEIPAFLKQQLAVMQRCQGMKIGQIVSQLGLMDEAEVVRILQSKPKEVLTVEWLGMQDVRMKLHINRILAIQHSILFLEDLNAFNVVSIIDEEHILETLRSNGSVLVYHDDAPNLWFLAFTSYASYTQFTQLTRFDLDKNPIIHIAKERNVRVVPCLAYSQSVMGRLSELDDVALDPRMAASVVEHSQQFWSGASAITSCQKSLASLIDLALLNHATDIDFHPATDGSYNIFYRQYGDLVKPAGYGSLSAVVAKEVAAFLMARSRANLNASRIWEPRDGQIVYRAKTGGDVFLRCSFVPVDQGGEDAFISISIRLQPRTVSAITLSQLNMPEEAKNIIVKSVHSGRGMILVAGPTNSGKSTTIAGIIDAHVQVFGSRKKRISMEDPIERYIQGVKQIWVDTKRSENEFEKVLKGLMRHDPDFIWVGEIRDNKTAQACVRAASSGHLVTSTLHANDTVIAIRELANMLEASRHFSLFESLNLIISQRLVKKVCEHCSTQRPLNEEEKDLLAYYCDMHGYEIASDQVANTAEANTAGCSHCNKGYNGLLPIIELLPVTRHLRDYLSTGIKDGYFEYSKVAKFRVLSLFESGLELVQAGKIEINEVLV
ncbi:MAG: Flp pilus assembly complex ATPase component TadA [Thiotrichales bacterium]|nr:Flp pilus assembly complex ATPase component TadA [Thiotrichales bacterium]